jgi:hypothetical protein
MDLRRRSLAQYVRTPALRMPIRGHRPDTQSRSVFLSNAYAIRYPWQSVALPFAISKGIAYHFLDMYLNSEKKSWPGALRETDGF